MFQAYDKDNTYVKTIIIWIWDKNLNKYIRNKSNSCEKT